MWWRGWGNLFPGASMKSYGVFIVAAVVVLLDRLSKEWVLNTFALFDRKTVVPGFFDLVYVTNTGAAFGLLSGAPTFWRHFFFIAVAFCVCLFLFFVCHGHGKGSYLVAFGGGLIIGGAMGNSWDRIAHGAVVDFLDFYVRGFHWPAFNIADSAITVGAALFIWAVLKKPDILPGHWRDVMPCFAKKPAACQPPHPGESDKK